MTRPIEVKETEHLWIEMPDGVRLAARMWRPQTDAPVPAIFEYIPYRKADMVRARDARNHPYFAAHGYACLRVDMRGSGDSEGVMPDMYAAAELEDARHVIDWIAAQPWCDGHVGMFGTSWGGTASLQANLDAPEALKAVIAVCATHDRYHDDIHHMGGCLLTDTFEWGATLPAILAAPPTPEIGPEWEAAWRARLEQLTSPVEHWVWEEAPGPYWHHGSVIHEADRLSRPILAIGGWSDRYSNSVMSLMTRRPDLVTGIVGPWGHHYPDVGHPGPGIGFQDVALDWWNRWLRGAEPRAEPPRLVAWMREFDPPENAIDVRRGVWVASAPPGDVTEIKTLYATATGLSSEPSKMPPAVLSDDLMGAAAAGDTGYFGRYGGLPLDQSAKDAEALCLETTPFVEDFVIFGAPIIDLDVQEPRGQVFIRLCDVSPDGVSSLICHAPYNLALGQGRHEVALPTTAYRLQAGHRLRVSLCRGGWPLIWPSAETDPINIEGLAIHLPRAKGGLSAPEAPFPPPKNLPEDKTWTVLSQPALERFSREEGYGVVLSGWEQPFAELRHEDTGHSFGSSTRAEYRIAPGDPLSAETTIDHRAVYTRPEGRAEIRSSLTARATAEAYLIDHKLTVTWRGEEILKRRWQFDIPRAFG